MSNRPASNLRVVLEALKAGVPPGNSPGGPAASPSAAPGVASGTAPGAGPAVAKGAAPGAAPGAADAEAAKAAKAAADYAKELAAVKALADGLAAHAQAARLTTELQDIAAKLAEAAAHATAADWPAAMKDLTDARALCVAAAQTAKDWQEYASLRKDVLAPALAMTGLFDDVTAALQAEIATADGQVLACPADFASAKATLNNAIAGLGAQFQPFVDDLKGILAGLKAQTPSIQTFLAKEITEGTALVAQLEAAFAAKEWSRLMMAWRAAWNAMGSADRYGQRRTAYDAQRVITAGAIATLKTQPALQTHGAALDGLLAKADLLASHDQLKMEEGIAVLKDASARCTALGNAAPVMTSHDTERAAADGELAQLGQHAAAAQIAKPLAAIGKQLTDAAASAARARANAADPGGLWQLALTQVQRARADLAEAKKLADGLGPAAAAQAAAGGGDVDAMRPALAALKADLEAARQVAHADLAKKPLDRCAKYVTEADKALTKGSAKSAGAALGEAAKSLAEAHTLQTQHARFETELLAVEQRLEALRKLPTAKAIGARIDAVAKAVAAARKLDKGADAEAAMAALRLATDTAAAADQADADRRAFDGDAKRVADRIKAEVTDPKLLKSLGKLIEEATKQADGFKFADSGKTLKRAEVEIGNMKLRAGMTTTPPDPQLQAIAQQMVADGGAASVDKAIQDSPEGNPAAILALASGRYGKPFKFDDAAPGAQNVKSMKRVCEMFATIPDDVSKNPSIADISHVDAVGSAGGGYTSSDAHIEMIGRVGIQQQFGTKEVNFDPKTNKQVKSLPKDIDPDCQPKDGKQMEYLGFAAAHEVGHGVDDKRGFMAQHGASDEYGGWISYGADCQPVADAVGGHLAGKFPASTFYKTAESRQYVLDMLMSKPPTRPTAALGTPDASALDAFDKWHAMATASDVYRRQSDCDAIQIGDRIYHEAYARSWVSYKAVARKKGLTGYQFRAPGEWFAELYAGWRSGKLGPKHPALKWLTQL